MSGNVKSAAVNSEWVLTHKMASWFIPTHPDLCGGRGLALETSFELLGSTDPGRSSHPPQTFERDLKVM